MAFRVRHCCMPEEFAYKVIETRVSGLKNIAENVGNICGGAANGIEVSPSHCLRFVICLDEELSVFRIGIVSDCLIENIEMMAHPSMLLENCFDPHTSSI